MKKNLTKTTTLLVIAIIFLGIYMYKEYVSPLYINNGQQTTQIDLSKKDNILLLKETTQRQIFALEIEILGESATNLTVVSIDSDGQAIKEIKLKKGTIDFIYQNDWYTEGCTLQFSAREKMKGKLKINYRFLGLN